MAKRALRKTNRTVLIVVEGETEKALLTHIKSLYYTRGMLLSVSIRNANGFGPPGIIDKLQSVCKTADYDERLAVFDADIPLRPEDKSWFQQQGVEQIISQPAIEGLLLAILGKQVPATTSACKKSLAKHAAGDSTDPRFYEKHLTRQVLDEARKRLPELERLIAKLSTE